MGIKEYFNNKKYIIFAGLFGVLAFIFLYWNKLLDFTNDKPILYGFYNVDILQNYLGWNAFRNDIWRFPLCMTKNLAFPEGDIISYYDSIPIFAIFFKIINSFLPKTFQYFGILLIFNFMLMGICSYKIIFLLTKNKLYSLISTIFFIFSPIFLYKAMSPGITTHWLILISIYEYILFIKTKNDNIWMHCRFLLYECLAMGIHPYFIPQVVIFYFVIIVKSSDKIKNIINFVVVQFTTIIFGIVLGTISKYGRTGTDDFGFFSMNLNSFINPLSECEGTGSLILKPLPIVHVGQYEGYNYLGLGIIIFILLIPIICLINKKVFLYIVSKIKEHFILIIIFFCCFLFAVSNVVTLNDKILFVIPLPDDIIFRCGIFRSSGRMFWGAYYSIFIFFIFIIYKIPKFWIGNDESKKKISLILLSIILFIQIFDMKNFLILRCTDYVGRNLELMNCSEEYIRMLKKNSIIVIDTNEPERREFGIIRNLAMFQGLKLCDDMSNSNIRKELYESTRKNILINARKEGILEKGVLICTDDNDAINEYSQFNTFECKKIGDIYFINNR